MPTSIPACFDKACEVLDRLVDIDSYDYRNQERLERLRGLADDSFLKRIAGRMARSSNIPESTAAPRKSVPGRKWIPRPRQRKKGAKARRWTI